MGQEREESFVRAASWGRRRCVYSTHVRELTRKGQDVYFSGMGEKSEYVATDEVACQVIKTVRLFRCDCLCALENV